MPEETRIEYLERNIAEIDLARSMLQNRSHLDCDEDDRLRLNQQRMRSELHSIRPYTTAEVAGGWVVAHRGMFIKDGNAWMLFETEAAAQEWISNNEGVAA